MPQRFLGGEEEDSVLFYGAADRSAVLVQTERSLQRRVEEIARVELAVSKIFKQSAVQIVSAGLADYADLTSRTCAELRRIVAGIDPELGNRLQAVLQAEPGGDLTVQIAGGGVDDRAGLDAVEAHGIFLIGTSAEPDIVEAASTRRLGAGRQQIELRKLPAVQWHFAGVDVRADGGGRRIHLREITRGDGDFRCLRSRLNRNVYVPFRTDRQRNPGDFRWS